MKKIFFIGLWVWHAASATLAQGTVDSVLAQIKSNNKTLITLNQFLVAKNIEYTTGLNLPNPKVDYDFLIGSPRGAGNQTDLVITQSFDLPQVYRARKQLAQERTAQTTIQIISARQDVLLRAKQLCVEAVYRTKLQSVLLLIHQNTQKWANDFQQRLDLGEGTILDVHKAQLELVDAQVSVQENNSALLQINLHLIELNGGSPLLFRDTVYESLAPVRDLAGLTAEILARDPQRLFWEHEKAVAQKEIELTKWLTYPTFDAGYHHQSILGQSFNGPHVGFTIPLLEHKNKVRSKQAQFTYAEATLQEHVQLKTAQIQKQYEKQRQLALVLENYQNVLSSSQYIHLLDRSLELGQITILDYFREMRDYYNLRKSFLKYEMEYQQALVELFKYRL